MSQQRKTAPHTNGAQAIRRAVDLLRAVAMTQRRGANLATLSRATKLSRSTAFRMLHSLTEEGLLDYDPASHFYRMGRLAYELGLAAQGGAQLVAQWSGAISRIRDRTGMTTYLVARSDLEVVCLAVQEGRETIRAVPLAVGDRLPLGVGGGSLAILASLDDDEAIAVIKANEGRLPLYGGGKLTPDALLERARRARTKGYACSINATGQGVIGMGLRLPDGPDLAQLAISISIPSGEMDPAQEKRLATLMQQSIEPQT